MSAADLAMASLNRLDAVASAMERKWGIGRLPSLVDAALALRFGSQRRRLDDTILADVPSVIAVQAEAMLRAWTALDAAALAAGWAPLSPLIWEAVLPSTGEIVAIVRDADDAHAISVRGKGTVWTLAEVALAIEAFGEGVRAAKRVFPSAEVTAVRPSATSPNLAIGSAAPAVATEGAARLVRNQAAHKRRSRSAGFSDPFAPALNTQPHRPPNQPRFDWTRGDDVPF